MTMRERILAVIRGNPHDRVPFVQYDGLAAPNEVVWDVVGRANMGIIRWSSVYRIEAPDCVITREPVEINGRTGERARLITPRGSLVQERVFEPAYQSGATRKHYVCDSADYEILLSYLRNVVVVDDATPFLLDRDALGDDGVPMVAVHRTPYQQMWIQWVSLEQLAVDLEDDLSVLRECLEALGNIERRIFESVCRATREHGVPFVDFPDNITAPAIGERYFRGYCVPFYDELAGMLRDDDAPVFVHMDGDLKPLWEAIGGSGVRGIDSLSPPPDNDTSCADAATRWPDMRLFVNFPSSVHLWEPEQIYSHAMAMLRQAGHTGRMQIQISENVPPGVWQKSFPVIVEAVRDFGKP